MTGSWLYDPHGERVSAMLIFLTRSTAQDTEPPMSQIQIADYFEQVTEYPENLLKAPLKHPDYTPAKSRITFAFGPKSARIDQNRDDLTH